MYTQNPHRLYPLISEAAALRKEGDIDTAIDMLNRAFQNFSTPQDHAQLHVGIGDCYRFSRQTEKAKDAYIKGVQLDPNNRVGLIGLATCEIYLGNFGPAQDYIDRVFELSPQDHYAIKTLALLNSKKNRNGLNGTTLTNGFYTHALPPVRPANPIVVRPAPHPPRPRVVGESSSERLLNAIRTYEEKLSESPRNIGAHEQLLGLYQQAGRLHKAWKMATDMLGIDSCNSKARAFLRQYPEQPDSPASAPAVYSIAPDKLQQLGLKPLAVSPAPAPKAIPIPMDEITVTISINGQIFEAVALIPPSEEPLRVELIDPELEHGGKGFVVARQRGGREPR